MKLTVGDVREILAGFEIDSVGGAGDSGEEFRYASPLGEDFIFAIFYEDNAESMAQALLEWAEGFDPEGHANELYNSNLSGVPESLVDLLEDAQAIKQHILRVARYVDRCVEAGEVLDEELSEERDRLGERLISLCLETDDVECVRNFCDEVVSDSNELEYSFRVRFGRKTYSVSVKEVE